MIDYAKLTRVSIANFKLITEFVLVHFGVALGISRLAL
jgi:hypothetical protein